MKVTVSKARLGLTSAALAAALTACVPIPVPQRNYVPNAADVTLSKGSSSCSFNSTFARGVVKTGNATIQSYLRTENADSAQAYAVYEVAVIEKVTNGRFSDVSLVASRITLTEKNRTLTARLEDKSVKQDDKFRYTRFRLRFPAPSGLAQTLTVSSRAGAIRIGGQSLPASTVRYDLKETPEVYIFPCIPA